MTSSRRRFIKSSITLAGISVLPPVIISSCFPWRNEQELVIDYIGSQENFKSCQHYFDKLKRNRFVFSSLEASLSGNSGIVFLDTDPVYKPAYTVMLLEQGKDIITTYPMGNSLSEYASISEFMEKYGRIVGLLNPLAFYPSIQSLREIIMRENISIQEIRINCHPVNLGAEFSVTGPTGTAQPLQRIISYISDSFPVSLRAEAKEDGELSSIHINFENFKTLILFDRQQLGWNMELTGADFSALTDHTGLLALNSDIEPRFAPDPTVMEEAIIANLEDFIQAVRERYAPRVNSLDGLASIILNNAVGESLQTGSSVNL